jgi:hypothetical protein
MKLKKAVNHNGHNEHDVKARSRQKNMIYRFFSVTSVSSVVSK